MPDILRVIGNGRLTNSAGPYFQVMDDAGSTVAVYEDNVKIAQPCEGQAVVLTQEYGRSGLIVTCCRPVGDPELPLASG